MSILLIFTPAMLLMGVMELGLPKRTPRPKVYRKRSGREFHNGRSY